MRTIIVLLLHTILSALTLQAAPLHVLAWDQNIAQRKLAIADGSKSSPIVGMHHFSRSAPIKISAQSEGLHILVTDRLSEDGKPLTVALKMPAGITRPLLLILPDKKSPTGIKHLILDDSVANFRWGSIRFINVTGEALVFRYEKKIKLIASGWNPVTVQPGGKTRNMAVAIHLRKDLKRSPLYSSIWKHRDDLRQLVFIVPAKDKSRGFVDLKFITQNRAVIAAEQKAAAEE